MFAFICKDSALFCLLFLVPLTYIIHILPFHPLWKAKEILCPEMYENDQNMMKTSEFKRLQDILNNFCFENPISYQGIMLFSMITCAISLYCKGYINLSDTS
tara:strand:+ start:258 stop:563 length:306 start_codon:yes stop_codon:yes gene_type:complete